MPAKKVYTIEDDGLHQPWHGLTFCNPPFGGRNGHVPWLVKFLGHANGIAIVRAYTSSGWFHEHVVPRAELLLFPKGKTQFVRPDGTVGKATGHGVVFIGMSDVALHRGPQVWARLLRRHRAAVALATGQARPELRSHGPTVIAARQIRRPSASVGRGPPNSQDVLALQSSRDLWLSGTRFAPSQCRTGPCVRYSRLGPPIYSYYSY